MKTYIKDPNSDLDYMWDWAEWLGETDKIESYEVIVPAGLTLESHSNTDTEVTAWISGGINNKSYMVTCRIHTVEERDEDRSAIYNMIER